MRATVSRASPVEMKVEDLVGGINDPIFGGTPEGKIFDPLGLGADESALYRRRCVEIKHGRICMVAFLGMTVGPNDVRSTLHQPWQHLCLRVVACTTSAGGDHLCLRLPLYPPTLRRLAHRRAAAIGSAHCSDAEAESSVLTAGALPR